MPSRVIREGWVDSLAIDSLGADAERFFLRLCLKADDFGRFPANENLLRNSLYPLRDDIRGADISRWMTACQKAGLIRCYEWSSQAYLEIPKFGQRLRRMKSKYPDNNGILTEAEDVRKMPDTCQADDSQATDKKRNESESETESETKRKRINGERDHAHENGASQQPGLNRAPLDRSVEKLIRKRMEKLLGSGEMATNGGAWVVHWIRPNADLVTRALDELEAVQKEGRVIENKGAWLTDLLKRWMKK